MRRVSVVGNSGSGKSTLGKALAAQLGTTFAELDSIFHQPDWEPLPVDEFTRRVGAITAGESWVIDGNYGAVRKHVWAHADTVIWIDLPRLLLMRQITWRTLRRIIRNEELWNGNRERWRNFFSLDPEESVIAWSWQKHADYRQKFSEAMTDPAHAHLRFIRLRTRREIRAFHAAPPDRRCQ